MSEWCQNRFEITGKSVCLDVLTQWIEGCETPRYRHAIQQSILDEKQHITCPPSWFRS